LILVFDNGYHGGTLSFSSRTNPVNLPHDFIFSTYNDIEATRPLITDDLAAILVEPMQGVGGMVPATEEFLRLLREASRAAGVLLIFDEVVTSRLHYHGLQGFHSIMPDLTTLGKYIGGGFSFGAFGGRADVMALFDPTSGGILGHSGTFNNNIFTMTAGVTAFKLLTEESIRRVNALGDLLRVKANEMVQEAGLPMKLSGIGSAIGFQYFGEQSEPLRDVLYFFLLKKGFMIGRRGFVSLNLAHMQEHVERLLDAIRAFVHFVS
jgi:glutamate-1-semialdehyde 2,1-aminomutase